MFKKVSELLEVGIESQILNALVPGNVAMALKNEKIGTIIKLNGPDGIRTRDFQV